MTLYPADYISCSVSGLDGEGALNLSFDYDALLADMQEKTELTQRQIEDVESLLSDAEKDFSVSKSSGLSNGDEISVESAFEKQLLKKYRVVFENGEVTYTVEGLTEILTFSINDYTSVDFYGFEGYGYGYVEIDTQSLYSDVAERIREVDDSQSAENFITNELYSYLYVSAEPYYFSELSNGDAVAVVLEMESAGIEEYGIRFSAGELQAEVEGLAPTETVSLEDYLTVTWEGFDGDGSPVVTFDTEALTADLEALFAADGRDSYGLTETEDTEEETGESGEDTYAETEGDAAVSVAADAADSVYSAWRNAFSRVWSKEDGFANGDEVTLTFSADASPCYLGSVGIYLENGSLDCTVEGLTAVTTIDLAEYMNCTLEGYDGAGYAYIWFDEEALAADLETFFEENGRGCYGALTEDDGEPDGDTAEESAETDVWDAVYEVEDVCSWYFSSSVSETEGIANGDMLTVDCSGDTDPYYIDDMGLYLTGGSKEIVAEGLAEPQEVDLADAVLVSVDGICPDLYLDVRLNYDISYAGELTLSGPESGYVSAVNGDTFSWTVEYDEMTLLRLGYTVTNNALTYEVSGLPTYDFAFDSLECTAVSELGDIALDWAADIIGQNPDWLLEQLNDGNAGWFRWDLYSASIESARKLVMEGDPYYNQLYVICRILLPMVTADGTTTEEELYFVMMWQNLVEETDGSITVGEDGYEMYSTLTSLEAVEALILEKRQADGNTEIYELQEILSDVEADADALDEVEAEEAEEEAETDLSGIVFAGTAEAPALSGEASARAAAVISYEGHTYARFDEELTWEEAAELCESMGGTLATVTSAMESAIMEQLLADSPYGEYWLGASDEAAEGSWNWLTGEVFDYTDWDGGQPDNYDSTENCLTVGSDFGYHWNDRSNEYGGIGFILELSAGTESDVTRLTELAFTDQDNAGVRDYVQDPYGKDHYSSLSLDASAGARALYSLNGDYEAFTANLSTWTEAESNASFEFLIVADGEILYSLSGYTKSDMPTDIRLDVRGVDRLLILAYDRSGSGNAYLFLNEAKLTLASEPADEGDSVAAPGDLTVVDSVNYTYYPYLWRDVYGDLHYSRTTFGANGGNVLWNLGGGYTGLSGTFTVSPWSFDEETSVNIRILADGETVYELEKLDKFQGAQPFELDLTGVNSLEIEVTLNGEEIGEDIYVHLADAVLTAASGRTEAVQEEPVFPETDDSYVSMASDIVTYGNYRYYRFDLEMSWQQAARFCEAAGGRLLCVTDEEKQAVAYYLASRGNYDEYWLGGFQQTGDTLVIGDESSSRGDWEWVSGEAFAYTNWNDGEPNNSNGEEYLLTIRYDGRWNDSSADYLTGFLMEVEAESDLLEAGDAALASLEWSSSENTEVWNNALDGHGDLHFKTIALNASAGGWLICDLDGAYESMSGSLSAYADAAAGISLEIGIFGDGELLYEFRGLTKNMEAQNFTVDLTGVKNLIVVTGNTGKTDNGYLLMGEIKLFLAGEAYAGALTQRLGDQTVVDSYGGLGGSPAGLFTDAWGDFHSSYISMEASADTYLLYNLNSGLTQFSGTLTVFSDTSRGMTATVSFYADGSEEPIARYDVSKDGGSVPVTIDITGVSTLRIVAETDDEAENTWIVLTDDRLW